MGSLSDGHLSWNIYLLHSELPAPGSLNYNYRPRAFSSLWRTDVLLLSLHNWGSQYLVINQCLCLLSVCLSLYVFPTLLLLWSTFDQYRLLCQSKQLWGSSLLREGRKHRPLHFQGGLSRFWKKSLCGVGDILVAIFVRISVFCDKPCSIIWPFNNVCVLFL